jgi:hypothetical protein
VKAISFARVTLCALIAFAVVPSPKPCDAQLLPTPSTYLLQVSLSLGNCSPNANPLFPSGSFYCGSGQITSSNTGCAHISASYMTFGGFGYLVPGTSGTSSVYTSNVGPIGGYLQPVVWQNGTSVVNYWVTSLVNISTVNVVLTCV